MLTVLLVAGSLSACASPLGDDSPGAREQLEVHLAAEPTTPVVVPRSLPEGYELYTGLSWQTGSDGPVFTASWEYGPTGGAPVELPVVELCVVRSGFSPEGLCFPRDHDVGAVSRDLGDLTVTIMPRGPDVDRADVGFWSDVALTTDWRTVSWLER